MQCFANVRVGVQRAATKAHYANMTCKRRSGRPGASNGRTQTITLLAECIMHAYTRLKCALPGFAAGSTSESARAHCRYPYQRIRAGTELDYGMLQPEPCAVRDEGGEACFRGLGGPCESAYWSYASVRQRHGSEKKNPDTFPCD